LQAANTVINVDLPWNPAVLEQRIARAHRMGQKQQVQVFNLVTEQTIEENLLVTLQDKRELALAALDPDSEVDTVTMTSGRDALKERLEILLGAKPDAFVDRASQQDERLHASQAAAQAGSAAASSSQGGDSGVPVEHRERVAAAGGEMLGAVFQFLGALVQTDQNQPPLPEETVAAVRNRLGECVEQTPDGKARLSIALPDAAAVDNLAKTLARLLVAGQQ
jgi:superfamily II DNA/RNA helicase